MAHAQRGDVLILTMTEGMSLDGWQACGTLEREWAVYARLAAHYQRIIVVTYGELAREQELARALPGAPTVIAGPTSDPRTWASGAAAAVLEVLPASARESCEIVVKTNQFKGGRCAAALAHELRAIGVWVALIGRAGYDDVVHCERIYGIDHAQTERARQDEVALFASADVLVATSVRAQEALTRRRPEGSRPPVVVVPNYVDVPGGSLEPVERRGWLSAGRLEDQKQMHLLIEAQRVLGLNAPTLTIVGEGSLRHELETRAAGLDVRFVGRLTHRDLLGAMRRCAVYAQVSAFEGHPKTVIEAMACGASVVVSEAPGLSDVVRHAEMGVVTTHEPGEIAAEVGRLFSDGRARTLLGENARREALAAYSVDTVLNRELEVHREGLRQAETARNVGVA